MQSLLTNPRHFLLEQTIVKFIWNHKDPELSKQSWEKRTKLEVSHFLTSDYIKTTVIKIAAVQFSSVQSLSCVQLFATAWMPGLPVHHQLSEFTQTLVHWVGDAIQPSHPLSSPSPPAPNPSQHQGLFQWVNSSHEVAKVLKFQPQHQSFQWTLRTYLL